jgi:hypothetical protein
MRSSSLLDLLSAALAITTLHSSRHFLRLALYSLIVHR